MNKILELIAQRRIWSGVVGTVALLLLLFGVEVSQPETLIDLLTNIGVAMGVFVSSILPLLSYFFPKEN